MAGLLSISIKGLSPAMFNNAQWKKSSLEQHVGMALEDSLLRLQDTALLSAFGQFQNPTGAMESHFGGQITSWEFPVISGMMFNDSPYAWRRDRGFSGMTDSLGRFYPNDPGVYYMEDALTAEMDWIVARFTKAVRQSLDELSTLGPTSGAMP
jgi:hypothetical protein